MIYYAPVSRRKIRIIEWRTRLVLLAAVCVGSAEAATIRAKSDRRLWETVDDRAALLTWPWATGADAATLVFSNRVTKAVSSVSVPRGGNETHGSCPQPAPLDGEDVVDVTLAQTAGGVVIARESAKLAYVNGAGGGPIEVRSNPGARAWSKVAAPRVYAVDPAWRGETGESGYDIAWPERRGLTIIMR